MSWRVTHVDAQGRKHRLVMDNAASRAEVLCRLDRAYGPGWYTSVVRIASGQERA